jgi:hypothetical protein
MLQMADLALELEDVAEAQRLGVETYAASRQRGQPWAVARSLHILGRVASANGDQAMAKLQLEQSLEIQEALPDEQGRVRSLAALAHVAALAGDTTTARQRFADSLRAARASYQLLEIARGLEGMAELDAITAPERALRLVGAASSLRKAIGAELSGEEARRLSAWLQTLYVTRGEKACAEARAAGRALSLDQAVAEALAAA